MTLNDIKKFYTQTDTFEFFGLRMTQIPEALIRISCLIQLIKPQKIIEFGTGYGGLSVLLSLYAKTKNIDFITYDAVLHRPDIQSLFQQECFRLRDLNDKEVIEEIEKEIQSTEGRVLLICDALKSVEINRYADKIKQDDVVIMHDYSRTLNGEEFQKTCGQYGWSAPQEQWFSNIQEECQKQNIMPLFHDEFEEVLWFCGCKANKEIKQ